MNDITFYAHSKQDTPKEYWQKLNEHLQNVSNRAAAFAAVFGASEWGRAAGLLHDEGKATKQFLQRLEGKPVRVNHSLCGARHAQEQGGIFGLLLSYVIAGHHGGLPDGGLQAGQLHHRLKHERLPADVSPASVDIHLDTLKPPFTSRPEHPGFSLSFFTRMLFSCLIDADFLDTEAFCTPEKASARNGRPATELVALRDALNTHLDAVERKALPSRVNDIRKTVLHDCQVCASEPQGLFSLTVPTGGGKTLSSMAFALDHAVTHGLRRVIYAIPFTSIIEQNAKVFSDVFGQDNVLEHHCNYRSKDEPEEHGYDKWRGLAAENWDAPVVVTTNVQFFESLFSNRPSRCRKLHSIARSVIVLDEAQAIPTEYLEPCLCALKELVGQYGCTVVLCTATQPAVDDASLPEKVRLHHVREIIADPQRLYTDLKRTEVTLAGKLTDAALAARLDGHEQVLCIVGTKPQAQAVFTLLQEREGAFHLSTNMYPEHRRRVLGTIRQRLADRLPCRVVSTSLIEAGVDVDFPVVYRAMAGLDSIAQAAGRCNREGGLPEPGQVVVYEPEKPPRIPWMQRCASRAQEALRTLPEADPLGLKAIRRYFRLLYDVQELDRKDIFKRLRGQVDRDMVFKFREIAHDFRFIDDEGTALVIPMGPEVEELVRQLRFCEFPRPVLRKLQQYSVTVRHRELEELRSAGAVEMIGDVYPVLRNLAAYSEDIGLCVDSGDVWQPEDLVS